MANKKIVKSYKEFMKHKARKRTIILIIVLLCILIPITAAAGYVSHTIRTSAVKIDTSKIYDDMAQKTVLYDDQGEEIESLFFTDGNREIIDYEDIPQNMINAVVSIEDKTFFDHHGFNIVRMIGAIKDSIMNGNGIHGTSTITQQLARNLYLSDIKSERTISRKILEAYYTIILERELTKREILAAYLNTVYFGYNSYGIEIASQNYFNKPARDMDLIECVSLAALPQAPDTYSLIKTDYSGVAEDQPVLEKKNGVNYLYGGGASEERRKLILKEMASDGKISPEEYSAALEEDLQKHIHVTITETDSAYTYFLDYTIDCVVEDLAKEMGITKEDARTMVYSKGLKIYTTLDRKIQEKVSNQINNANNYTSIKYIPQDGAGNIVDQKGNILLRPYSYYFGDGGSFYLHDDEYEMKSNGDLVILKDKRLALYDAENGGVSYVQPDFLSMYQMIDGVLYLIEGGSLNIPAGFTKFDKNGNCVVSKTFLENYPNFFEKDGDDYRITSDCYTLKQKTRQPQAAACVMENSTGKIKAMTGGRGARGKYLFNRATNPRQPGSSIKPIAVYGPALQLSVDTMKDNRDNGMDLNSSDGSRWGDYITASSVINDAPMTVNGKNWPKNVTGGYMGRVTLRTSVQQSINVCSVKTLQQIGTDYSAKMLKKNGITTIDEDGEYNDINLSALGLGGMTNGISPLELTAAYATFPNKGVYKSPRFYTEVKNADGKLILEKDQETRRVYDEGVAFIMTDILQSVVSKGIGNKADFYGQPVGGKTGTTSDQYDIWFAGFTPKYSMALWEGNDINLALSSMSGAAASFWSTIMSDVCDGQTRGEFPSQPGNVTKVRGEYYVDGTYSGVTELKEKRTEKKRKDKEEKKKKKESKSESTKTNDQSTTEADDDVPIDFDEDDWVDNFFY